MSTLTEFHPGFQGLIGAAREDITPPVGIYSRCWGAATHDIAEGIHRPLTCTALALAEAEGPPLVLIALDLGWWQSRQDEWFVRGALLDALGIGPERVVVNMAHTHAGPVIYRGLGHRPGGQLIAPYLTRVRDACIAAARAAIAAARPGVLEWASGTCALARNRDLPDPHQDRVLCGFHPGGAADGTVLVGRATDTEGAPLATIVNYACHPTTLAWTNRLLSPDYVGALRESVEDATAGAPCLFLQGCSGDQGPREGFVGDAAIADANGRMLGLAVQAVLAGMLPSATALGYAGVVESGARLATWQRQRRQPSTHLAARQVVYRFALKPLPTIAEIEREIATTSDRVLQERLQRRKAIRELLGDGTSAETVATCWRLGEAALLAQPQEAYARFQVDLRRRCAMPVAVLNLSNGPSIGYLPPREWYERDCYQVWQTPFAAGSMEHGIEQCASAVASLFPVEVTVP